MEQKTIGGFIAALRKSRGMTQQEVADRLNVSNKTISKWERDEGYPEITIIPALAELFEVTSDEILRGERIPQSDREPEKHAARVEKQIRRIVNSSIARFQNFSYLAAALALAGLICLFTTAYAFYRPVLGFGVMLIFVIASITTELFLTNTCRTSTRDHEIIGDREMLDPLWKTANRYSFAVFMINIAMVILALPFILVRDSHYVESVISMKSYLSMLPTLVLIIALLCVFLLNIFKEKLFLSEKVSSGKVYPVKRMRRMNFTQGAALAAALIISLFGCFYLDEGNSFLSHLCIAGFFAMLGLIILSMIVPVVKSQDSSERYMILAAGLRNLLYAFAVIYALHGLTVIYPAHGEREILYTFEPGVLWILLDATVAYLLARYFILKRNHRNQDGEQEE